jgi:hypothetical protein
MLRILWCGKSAEPVGYRRQATNRADYGGHAMSEIHFNIQVKLDLEELARLQPEQVSAIMGGIAAVLSAKSLIHRAAEHKEHEGDCGIYSQSTCNCILAGY